MIDRNFYISKLILDGTEINMEAKKRRDVNNFSFISILIGENGVGKSRILSKVEQIFCELYMFIEDEIIKDSKVGNFFIEYYLDGKIYEAMKNKNYIQILVNKCECINKSEFKIPSSVLCCAFYLNDRFVFRKDNTGFTKYLGVKTTPTMTNSSSITKRISNNLLKCTNCESRLKLIKDCFEFLNLERRFIVSYDIKQRSRIFSHDIKIDNIVDLVENSLWANRNRNSAFGRGMFEEIKQNPELLNRIVKQLNAIKDYSYSRKSIELQVDIDYGFLNFPLFFDNEAIEILIRLDILSNPKTTVYKGDGYELTEGSSGELHLLFLLSNIIVNLQPNSVILIDEPEVSLHPSWQIRIIEHLRHIINASGMFCHIIIATHSHFTIADLDKSYSSLHILHKDYSSDHIICDNVESNTFGWSAENILYNVFGVPTSRNYYLAKELDSIFLDISKGNIDKIKTKGEELNNLHRNLMDNDPLKVIVEKILNRIKEN